MTAWPAPSLLNVWMSAGPMISPPRGTWAMSPTRLPIVPLDDEQAGLRAEELGGAFLERADGRVLAEDVVADLGLGHRATHGRGGQGDGVGPEVDHAVPAGPGRRRRVAHHELA